MNWSSAKILIPHRDPGFAQANGVVVPFELVGGALYHSRALLIPTPASADTLPSLALGFVLDVAKLDRNRGRASLLTVDRLTIASATIEGGRVTSVTPAPSPDTNPVQCAICVYYCYIYLLETVCAQILFNCLFGEDLFACLAGLICLEFSIVACVFDCQCTGIYGSTPPQE